MLWLILQACPNSSKLVKATMPISPQLSVKPFAEDRAPRQILVVLIVGVFGISALSLIANILWMNQVQFASKAMLFFDVDQEKSLATWWATVTLASLGVLTWFVGQSRPKTSFGERLGWWMLAFGFVFLSVDESCMLHERIGGKTAFGVDTPFEYARWIIVWLPLAALFGGFIFWKMWRGSKRTVIGLTVGAVVFLAGAVGTEIINSKNRYAADSTTQERLRLEATDFEETQPLVFTGKENYAYIAGTAIEEFLEMLGVVIWFWVMFRARAENKTPKRLQASLLEAKPLKITPAVAAGLASKASTVTELVNAIEEEETRLGG